MRIATHTKRPSRFSSKAAKRRRLADDLDFAICGRRVVMFSTNVLRPRNRKFPARTGGFNEKAAGAGRGALRPRPGPGLRTPAAAGKIYWADAKTGAVGRANLNGTGVDRRLHRRRRDPLRRRGRRRARLLDHRRYPADPGAIGRANLNGGALDLGFITGGGSPQGVAVDDEHVYWSSCSRGTIGRAKLERHAREPALHHRRAAPHACGGQLRTRLLVAEVPPCDRAGQAERHGRERSFITVGRSPCAVEVGARHVYWSNGNAIGRAKLTART